MDIKAKAQNYYSTEDTEEYKAFEEKFKPKRTTDDCYTPPEVYEVVKQWTLTHAPHIQGKRIVRPFYPGGDYTREDYTNAVVIDNPPFSILAEIKRYYNAKGIPFLLFAPSKTLFTSDAKETTAIVAQAVVRFSNGAMLPISFVSNLFPGTAVILEPDLKQAIEDANRKAHKEQVKSRPRYQYPTHVISGALLQKYLTRGLRLEIPTHEVHFIRALDHQRKHKKALYGAGYLVSDRVARVLQETMEQPITPRPEETAQQWELSSRELAIIKELSQGAGS